MVGRANIGRGSFPGDIEIWACWRSSILGHLRRRSLIGEYRFAPSSSAPRHGVVEGDASGASPRTPGIYRRVLNPEDRNTSLVSCIHGRLSNVEPGCRTRLLHKAGRPRLAGSLAKSMGIKGKDTLSSVTMGAPPPKPPRIESFDTGPGRESEKAKRGGSEGSAARFQSPGWRSSIAGEAITLACAGSLDDGKKASQCENDDCPDQSQSHWRPT